MVTQHQQCGQSQKLGAYERWWRPAGEKLDPRAAIGGRFVSQELPGSDATASTSGRDAAGSAASASTGQGHWQSGLFDKGSWVEAQAGWARSVVTGRARLAGIACGALST